MCVLQVVTVRHARGLRVNNGAAGEIHDLDFNRREKVYGNSTLLSSTDKTTICLPYVG